MHDHGTNVVVTGTPKESGRLQVKPELIGRTGTIISHAASTTPTLYIVEIDGKEYALHEDEIEAADPMDAYDHQHLANWLQMKIHPADQDNVRTGIIAFVKENPEVVDPNQIHLNKSWDEIRDAADRTGLIPKKINSDRG